LTISDGVQAPRGTIRLADLRINKNNIKNNNKTMNRTRKKRKAKTERRNYLAIHKSVTYLCTEN
jgi:hypothetical protein